MFCSVVCPFSSTLNARCPATGIDESAEEDHPHISQLVNFLLPSRASAEDMVLRSVQLICWITHTGSRGDPQEVMNLGLAALDSPLEIVSRLSSSTRNLFSLPLGKCPFAAFAHSSGSDISFWKFTCGPFNVCVPIGYELKLLSNFIAHSSSCWSCCLQLVPILRRPAPKTSFLESVGLHPVIICTLVLSPGTHRVERTCCDCGLFTG